MDWCEDFRVEGRVIDVDEIRGTPRATLFFPFTREAISLASTGTFLLADSRRRETGELRAIVMQIVSSEVFHSGLVGLDPKRLPFPTSVLEVARAAHDDLISDDLSGSSVRLAGMKVTALGAGYEVWGTRPYIESSGEHPLLGSKVYKPTSSFLDLYFNKHIGEEGRHIFLGEYHSGADGIRILANPYKMTEHHVGVFGSTGAGKSFLMSNIIASGLSREIRFIVYDCAPEFPALLADVLQRSLNAEEDYSSSIILRNPDDIPLLGRLGEPETSALFNIPDPIKSRYGHELHQLMARAQHALRPMFRVLLPASTTESLARLIAHFYSTKRAAQAELISQDLQEAVRQEAPGRVVTADPTRIRESGVECIDFPQIANIVASEQARHDEESQMAKHLEELRGLLAASVARTDTRARECIESIKDVSMDPRSVLITPELIFSELVRGGTRLQIILSDFEDPTRDLISSTIGYALQSQRDNPNKPHVMFVVDEAHEFVPQGKGESSWAIERLAREGRKLHLGLLMASQRCTYLNTSVMAQLGTVFFTNLKMRSDRERIEQAFDIDRDLIDSSTLLGPREWYVVSSHATGLKSYPIHIEAPDVIARIGDATGW